MKKNKKYITAALVGCASLGILAGCSNDSIEENQKVSDNKNDIDSTVEIVKDDQLTVDPNKCIGCGKCPRFAPDNFAMDSNRKAEVISQEIVSQPSVSKAINACPTSAISQ